MHTPNKDTHNKNMVIFVRGFESTASFTYRTSLLKKNWGGLVTLLHPFAWVDAVSLGNCTVSGQGVIGSGRLFN